MARPRKLSPVARTAVEFILTRSMMTTLAIAVMLLLRATRAAAPPAGRTLYLKAVDTLTTGASVQVPVPTICLLLLEVNVTAAGKVAAIRSLMDMDYDFWCNRVCPEYVPNGLNPEEGAFTSASCRDWTFTVESAGPASQISGSLSIESSVWCRGLTKIYDTDYLLQTASLMLTKSTSGTGLVGEFSSATQEETSGLPGLSSTVALNFAVVGGPLLGISPPTPCPPGMEPTRGLGALAGCKLCALGTVSTGSGACQQCLGATYGPQAGAAKCLTCTTANTVPRPAGCGDAVSPCAGPNAQCATCPATHHAQPGWSTCKACPATSYWDAASGSCFRCTPSGSVCCTSGSPKGCTPCNPSTAAFTRSARLALTAVAPVGSSSRCAAAVASHCLWGLDVQVDHMCTQRLSFWRPPPAQPGLHILYVSPVDGGQVACRDRPAVVDLTKGSIRLDSSVMELRTLLDNTQDFVDYNCRNALQYFPVYHTEFKLGITTPPRLKAAAGGNTLELTTSQCKFTYEVLSGSLLSVAPRKGCARLDPGAWQCVPGLPAPFHLGVFRWWNGNVQAASADGKTVLTNAAKHCGEQAALFSARRPPPRNMTCAAADYDKAGHWCNTARSYLKQFFAKDEWQCSAYMPSSAKGFLTRLLGGVVQCASSDGKGCYSAHSGPNCWASLRELRAKKLTLNKVVNCTTKQAAKAGHWCAAAKAYLIGLDSKCGACTPGRFALKTVNGTTCALCAPGTYAEKPGATACKPCSPGRYAWGVGSSSCAACPAAPNFYGNVTGAASCKGCANFCAYDCAAHCETDEQWERCESQGCPDTSPDANCRYFW